MSEIDTYNINTIALTLINRYNYILSAHEINNIHNEAQLIYKMIKENKEYMKENGVTYHLGKDLKEYLERKLML